MSRRKSFEVKRRKSLQRARDLSANRKSEPKTNVFNARANLLRAIVSLEGYTLNLLMVARHS